MASHAARLLPLLLALLIGTQDADHSTDAPHGARLRLPEPIDAPMLAKVLLEQPHAYTVLDLRPSWQFAEWSIAGAENIAVDDLVGRLPALPADTRIVLVDRDGSLAFAVAGALMNSTDEHRELRVLLGGLQAYHRDVVLGGRSATQTSMPTTTPRPPATPAPVVPAPQKKRSAGC